MESREDKSRPAAPGASMTLARELAIKARELVDGMRKRVNRDPDIADFEVAFRAILTRASKPNESLADRAPFA